MRNIGIIMRRELGAYFRTPSGYLIAAATLLVQGLLFNTRGLGGGAKLSSQVLQDFLRGQRTGNPRGWRSNYSATLLRDM